MKIVDVAVGVIHRDQHIFISKRAEDLHQGGLWEFPGGKIEADESVEQATARELFEEVGIEVIAQSSFMLIEHDYGDKQVRLHIQLVEQFDNEPQGKEGQLTQWTAINELHNFTFPEANKAIIAKLESDF